MKLKKLITGIITTAMLAVSAMPLSSNAVMLQDPNNDNRIEMADYIRVVNYLYGRTSPTVLSYYDVDRNGVISMLDAISIQLYITQQWNGEV